MQINFTGGAAIIVLIFMWGLGGFWIWIHIFGGGFNYETEGLIPKLRRFRKYKYRHRPKGTESTEPPSEAAAVQPYNQMISARRAHSHIRDS